MSVVLFCGGMGTLGNKADFLNHREWVRRRGLAGHLRRRGSKFTRGHAAARRGFPVLQLGDGSGVREVHHLRNADLFERGDARWEVRRNDRREGAADAG